jgi:hypothetical protein
MPSWVDHHFFAGQRIDLHDPGHVLWQLDPALAREFLERRSATGARNCPGSRVRIRNAPKIP